MKQACTKITALLLLLILTLFYLPILVATIAYFSSL